MDISKVKIYLNDIQIFDIPNGLEDLVLSIIRERGVSNQEQILRDSFTSTLEFFGDGFKIICDQRKENYCKDIRLDIYYKCSDEYKLLSTGIIKQSKVEIDIHKKIANVNNIKDNSFSGFIRDFIDVEIGLYNTKTKNCEQIELPITIINTPTTPNTYTMDNVNSFDVLDILKYIVGFFTDNRITVKSDYLTNVKIAITKGYNLHNGTTMYLDKSYPNVSFGKVIVELRKKEVLYMAVEYESDGTPYIRIEEENKFYADDKLFTIEEVPLDAVEEIDTKRMFNVVEVGSSTTELKDGTTPIVEQDRLTAWNKETYVGCGGCSDEKETGTLNLVNDFIIDANLLHEAMNEAVDSDYAHDDAIFMFNYYFDDPNNKLVGNNLSNYNERFNNEETLERWVGVRNNCIAVNRFNKHGFKAKDYNDTWTIQGAVSMVCSFDKITFGSIEYDNDTSLSTDTINSFSHTCNLGPVTESFTIFTCSEAGIYNFKSKAVNLRQDGTPFELDEVDYTLTINVYSDDTYATLLNSYDIVHNTTTPNTPVTFEVETGNISLAVGNVVQVDLLIEFIGGALAYNYPFSADYISFELLSDNTSCEDITDDTGLFKPFITKFTYPLTIEQYLSIRENKKGYIMIDNNKCWIDQISYKPNNISEISVIHKNTFCTC